MKAYQNVTKVMNATPQRQPIPGRTDQVKNNAGGFVFQVDKWKQLERFIVLGSEGGTYYVAEKELTLQNTTNVLACIKEDGKRVVDIVAEISDSGRAPRNTPAEFVLALCAKSPDAAVRSYALAALPRVCRIGTHLFHFVSFLDKWGRGVRGAVGHWYNDKTAYDLAYQIVKYQSRDGWGHKDVLILAHPKPVDSAHNLIYNYVVNGMGETVAYQDDGLRIINAVESAKKAKAPAEIVRLIAEYNLPRECIPTEFLNDRDVWAALLEKMPITATIRNLAKMTTIGLLTQGSAASKLVIDRITNESLLRKGRVHPVQMLFASRTYGGGKGFRGYLEWSPVPKIMDALDTGFYLAFRAVEPTGKNLLLALDISGSMGSPIMDSNVSCREATAAMALVTASVEKDYNIVGFHDRLIPLDITPRRRLDDVVSYMHSLGFGATDCAQPMLYALENGINADAFVIYTDSETWHGGIHPVQALKKYREVTGIPAKLIVVAMTATELTVNDPTDPLGLDCAGFDASVPAIISDFIKG